MSVKQKYKYAEPIRQPVGIFLPTDLNKKARMAEKNRS